MRETTWNAWYRKEKCKGIPSGVGAGEVLIFLQGCELGGEGAKEASGFKHCVRWLQCAQVEGGSCIWDKVVSST